MKKKTLLSITTTAIICSLFAGAIAEEYTKYSSRFIKKFKDCDAYEETVNSTFENKTFKTNRKIIGWRNGFCRYEQTITSPEDQYRLLCSLTSIQVDDLYSTMKKKTRKVDKTELEIFAPQTTTSGVKYNVVGTQTIKGTPAYLAWTKIQNNPYFCTPQKLK